MTQISAPQHLPVRSYECAKVTVASKIQETKGYIVEGFFLRSEKKC